VSRGVTKKENERKRRRSYCSVRNTHTDTVNAHSVVHCGLGIGLAAGKCCAERIG
jgi:hypothetical protein